MGIGKEWGAYRSVVNEAREIYGSDLNKLPKILRWPLSAAAHLIAEIDGAIMYPMERLRWGGYSPEAISQRSETLTSDLKR